MNSLIIGLIIGLVIGQLEVLCVVLNHKTNKASDDIEKSNEDLENIMVNEKAEYKKIVFPGEVSEGTEEVLVHETPQVKTQIVSGDNK